MSARGGSRGAGGLLPAGGGMGQLPGGVGKQQSLQARPPERSRLEGRGL